MRVPLTLSKYIAKQFLIGVGVIFSVLTALIIVFDSLETVRRSHDKGVPFGSILEMVIMKTPTIVQEIIPFAILFGGIVSFARLTRTSELVVARSAGISVWQFLTPAVLLSFALGVFIMTVFNPLAATMLSRYEQIEAKYLHGTTSMLSISSTGLWLRQQNGGKMGKTIIHALRVTHEDLRLYDVTFYLFGENNYFDRRVDAKSAKLEKGYWYIKDAILTVPGKPPEQERDYHLSTNLTAHQIQDSFAPPKTMSFWELPGFIKTLKEAGFSALRHSLHWHNVLVTPFLLSAMVFFAAVFSLRLPRKGKIGVLMVGGIFAGFIIRVLSDIVSAIGLSGSIPIVMAAWTPVGISILLGMALMLHLEDG